MNRVPRKNQTEREAQVNQEEKLGTSNQFTPLDAKIARQFHALDLQEQAQILFDYGYLSPELRKLIQSGLTRKANRKARKARMTEEEKGNRKAARKARREKRKAAAKAQAEENQALKAQLEALIKQQS